MLAKLPASHTKILYSIMITLPCAYPFVIVTTLPLFLVKCQGITVTYSDLTVFMLEPTPPSTHQFVMTFFPGEFEQKDKVHVMKLKAKKVFNYMAMNTLLWLLPSGLLCSFQGKKYFTSVHVGFITRL